TLAHRQSQIPLAEKIIDEVAQEFNTWNQHRSFAPTIKALKQKLSQIKEGEIDNQRKKIAHFNTEQAEVISDRIIQKITTQVVNHLKNANGTTQQDIDLLHEIFQLENKEL
ncbi:MAG: glutamyl-tRNA reductase, partial [Bacteroidetes bacterium]|nr:glutamyl-tRNA reductase [Bacteroidota bacterium]